MQRRLSVNRFWFILATGGTVLLIWQGMVLAFQFPSFILPSPLHTASRFLQALNDGTLLRHLMFTLEEVLVGLLIGAGFAISAGYLLAKSPPAERLLSPVLVASQAVPLVAIAPLLVIWFGAGMFSKVLVCSLTVFFPVLINTIIGIRAVPADLRDLMRTLQATPRQILFLLEIPAALPVLFGGLRVGATLSVIGAVVGEFVGSDRGLGFLINVGRGQYDTALVFTAVITLITMAVFLYYAVVTLEHGLLRWNQYPEFK